MQRARRRSVASLAVAVIIVVAGSLAGCSTLSSSSPLDAGRSMAQLALALVDTPYRYGGDTPREGFDCSGLISYVSARDGSGRTSKAPRTVRALSFWGEGVALAEARAGDLVFFGPTARAADHAGIYLGDGRFVHAPSTGGKVQVDRIESPYWKKRLFGIRRPPPGR